MYLNFVEKCINVKIKCIMGIKLIIYLKIFKKTIYHVI